MKLQNFYPKFNIFAWLTSNVDASQAVVGGLRPMFFVSQAILSDFQIYSQD